MDSQIRNFRDFLQLYNKLTEMCFLHCADNFFNRQLSTEESNCLDKCVLKFSNVNQRVMGAYITDQSLINERRMKEAEAQMKVANDAAATAAISTTDNSNISSIDTTTSVSNSNTTVITTNPLESNLQNEPKIT